MENSMLMLPHGVALRVLRALTSTTGSEHLDVCSQHPQAEAAALEFACAIARYNAPADLAFGCMGDRLEADNDAAASVM